MQRIRYDHVVGTTGCCLLLTAHTELVCGLLRLRLNGFGKRKSSSHFQLELHLRVNIVNIALECCSVKLNADLCVGPILHSLLSRIEQGPREGSTKEVM